MTPITIILTILVGIVAGFINTIAGGGSLLSLPFLVFLGLDASVANATNRVAILLQNTVGTFRFKKKGVLNVKEALLLAFPALIGAVLGTYIVINIDERFLKLVIAVIISIMAALLILKPKMWETQKDKHFPMWAKFPIFFLIGVYGGFIQAGVGFILIWALVGVLGKDLVRANALKVAIVLTYTTVSLALFASKGMVDFVVGFSLAAGNMCGAYVGTWFAVSKGNRWIRYILAAAVFVSAIRMASSALGA
ncbi:MAG: sulfite exporter TauE/SafE family protein [Thermovirga sp.]|nr:sulfite exporter TauE/SafE family protein [Thermovirga sp.]